MSSDLEIWNRSRIWANGIVLKHQALQSLVKFITLVPNLETGINLIKNTDEDTIIKVLNVARDASKTEVDIMDSIKSAIFLQALYKNIILSEIDEEDLNRLYKIIRWLIDLVINP
jgi:hypothetical protein